MMFFWIFLFLLVVWAVWRFGAGGRSFLSKEEDPLEVLRRRYARGEISTEEYEERKAVLERDLDSMI